jgi:hypothetical protein
MSTPTKEQIITLLHAWISQRPGLEAANYFGGGNYAESLANYRAEVRSIGKDLAHARQLLRAVELSGITAEEMMAAFPRAYSGRLSLVEHPKKPGSWALDYCTGQYWPTEYRRAACAVLASMLWDYKRSKCMPPAIAHGEGDSLFPWQGKPLTAGSWIRASFRREFGRGIANRWFD